MQKTENNHYYQIIRYNKKFLNFDLYSTFGLLHSVIVNQNNRVVSFSPPKSMPADEFIRKYPEPIPDLLRNPDGNHYELVAEEFIEGTMVNVFWDETIGLSGAWEIATRNVVGGMNAFYLSNPPTHTPAQPSAQPPSSDLPPNSTSLPSATATATVTPYKTFRTMFLEAMRESRLTFDILEKSCSYSFVLQHPENRIVVPFQRPQLYLVAVYYCVDYRNSIHYAHLFSQSSAMLSSVVSPCVHVYPMDMEFIKTSSPLRNTYVQYPKRYPFINYTQLIQKYASMNTSYDIMGVVIHNRSTGERMKLRNPVYEQVRQLKGNQPKLQYQYLSLRKEGKVGDYLKYYPEHKKEFSQFRDYVHLFTDTLFQNYVSCFIKKEKNHEDFNKQYKHHMWKLHQMYLNEKQHLSPSPSPSLSLSCPPSSYNHKYITKQDVIEYVNKLHPSQLMYSLNYPFRERSIDFVVADDNKFLHK